MGDRATRFTLFISLIAVRAPCRDDDLLEDYLIDISAILNETNSMHNVLQRVCRMCVRVCILNNETNDCTWIVETLSSLSFHDCNWYVW